MAIDQLEKKVLSPGLVRKSPVPLYMQLKEIIRSEIETGKLKQGDPLSLEEDLCKEYATSRITVGRALRELAEEGLVVRIKHKGTFVARRPVTAGIDKARVVRKQKQKRVAFIVPEIEDTYASQAYVGVDEAAKKNGYHVAIYASSRRIDREVKNIQMLFGGSESGAIIFPNWGRSNAEQIFELKRNSLPFVLLNRYFRDIKTDFVVTDNKKGAYEATSHLLRSGHRRIACIGWVDCTAIEDRLDGYREALGEYGVPYDPVLIRSIFDEDGDLLKNIEPTEGGYEEMKKLLGMSPKPTAVFVVSDRLAIGAMRAIHEAGLSIPEDIAIVGFDNAQFSALLEVPLTTYAQPAREAGKKAMEILIKRIEEKENQAPDRYYQVILPGRLIIRKSCGAHLVTEAGA